MVVDTSVVSLIFNQHSLAAAGKRPASACSRQPGPGPERHYVRCTVRNYSICYPTVALCRLWGAVFNESKRKGRPIGHADTWIAATALYLDVPLVTHNTRHFLHIGGLRIA